jgi:hypothetical protein
MILLSCVRFTSSHPKPNEANDRKRPDQHSLDHSPRFRLAPTVVAALVTIMLMFASMAMGAIPRMGRSFFLTSGVTLRRR